MFVTLTELPSSEEIVVNLDNVVAMRRNDKSSRKFTALLTSTANDSTFYHINVVETPAEILRLRALAKSNG